ncbi:495_t:CDS:2 [Acaulospora colombiana]|uniref:495_t:CDS:1 n=1 Tax=Acaulospora colombiana TaxID=27376 RepID=A0ACA9MYG1_9GLOM|nr:495_t:CDS:2 [Acaulospora colombiana]
MRQERFYGEVQTWEMDVENKCSNNGLGIMPKSFRIFTKAAKNAIHSSYCSRFRGHPHRLNGLAVAALGSRPIVLWMGIAATRLLSHLAAQSSCQISLTTSKYIQQTL